MVKPCPRIPTLEEVRHLYCDEGLTVVPIARIFHCRTRIISAMLKDAGLHRKVIVEKDWLIEHYVIQQRSVLDIAADLQRDEATVRSWLRLYGIPIRYRSRGSIRKSVLNDPAWLAEHYVTKGLSLRGVADAADCRISSVVRALVRFGIERPHYLYGQSGGASRKRDFLGKVRVEILARDGYRCRWPGCDATEPLELHHIVPVAKGGPDCTDNGITLCKTHHRGIASREAEYAALFYSLISSDAQEPSA